MDNWLVAVFPMLGIVIGASLQAWLNRAAERDKHSGALRDEAYADYLRVVAASGHLTSDQELVSALRSAADAKTRNCRLRDRSCSRGFGEIRGFRGDTWLEAWFRGVHALVTAMRAFKSLLQEHEIRSILLGPRSNECRKK